MTSSDIISPTEMAAAIKTLRAALLDGIDRVGNTWQAVEPDLSRWAAARAFAERAVDDPSVRLPEGMNRSLVSHFMANIRMERAFVATRDLARRLGVAGPLDG